MIYKVLTIVVLVVASLLIADYHALLGEKRKRTLDTVHLTFEVLNPQTSRRIEDVSMNCLIRGGSGDVCRQQLADNGDLILSLSLIREEVRSWLFTQSNELLLDDDRTLNISFIHPQYDTTLFSISTSDIPELRNSVKRVYMIAHKDPEEMQ